MAGGSIASPSVSSLAAGAFGGGSSAPETVTVDAFARWPIGAQIALVESFAGGLQPPAVLVGFPGNTAIARLTRDGTDVDLAATPAGFALAPDRLDPEAFRTWPAEAQIFYLQRNGAQSGTPVTVGDPAGVALEATLVQDAGGTATGASLASLGYAALPGHVALRATPPADLTPAAFFSLTPDEQADFARANSATNPPVIRIGVPAGSAAAVDAVTLASRSGPYVVEVARGTFAGFSTAVSGQTSSVADSAFRSWPRDVQRAYVEAQGGPTYPKTLIVGDTVATVAAAGGEVDRVSKPAGFDGTAPAAGTFLSWPEAAQIAYARRAIADRGTAPPLALTGASADQTLTVSLDPSGAGIVRASAAAPAVAPSALDLDLFALWPASDQASYLRARGGGTPTALLAGNGQPSLLTLDSGSALTVEPLPGAFYTAPGSLPPATFQSWSQGMQNLYVTNAGAATASGGRMVTIGPASQALTVTLAPADLVPGGGSAIGFGPSMAMLLGLAIPTANTLGGTSGLDPDPNRASALALDPILDGTAGTTAAGMIHTIARKPADFAKAPADLDPAEFNQWHTAIQLEYLRNQGATQDYGTVQIGKNVSSGQEAIDVFINSTGTKIYTVQAIQKQDIAKMSNDDQRRLIQIPAFSQILAATGLSAYDVLAKPTDANYKTTVNYLMDMARAQIANPSATADRFPVPGGDGGMSADDKKVFSDQIDNLQNKFSSAYIISAKDINDQLTEIMNRFNRANSFAMTVTQANRAAQGNAFQWSPIMTDAKSSTGNATIQQNWSTYTIYDTKDGKYHNLGQYMAANMPDLSSLKSLDKQSVQRALGIAPGQNETYLDLVDENTGQKTGRTITIIVQDKSDINGTPVIGVDFRFSDNDPREALLEAPTGGTPQPAGAPPPNDLYYTYRVTFSISATQKPAVSTDDNQTVNSGYAVLMQQERAILELQNRRASLADTGAIQNQALDVPTLVYLFQLYANQAGEAKIRADSEEINQTNALLKSYAVMQRLINNTTRAFGKSDDSSKALVGSGPAGALTDEEKAAYAMFNFNPLLSSQGANQKHPIELLKGLTRPTYDLSSGHQVTSWQTFGTQLSDTVNLINQEAQILTNSVNSQTKQKDRNFDLANNALSKLSEIVQKIANAA